MNKEIGVSGGSKIILIGEHAVIYVIRYCFTTHHIEVICCDHPGRQSMDFV